MTLSLLDSIPAEVRSYCPVCDATNIRWQPLPNQYLNMWKHYGFKHIGSSEMTPLYTYSCPVCGASDRERLYTLFLHKMKAEQGFNPKQTIHFAPESALSKHIRKERYFASYKTADISMSDVDFHADLQSLTFENDFFDFFICSHVLEHVPDDRKAIRELFRVTRPGGSGLLMAPVYHNLETTLEAPSITDIGERWRIFGQNDHLRLYSHDDYVTRIKESGFSLQQMTEDDFGEIVFRQLGLKASSILYVVSKPVADSTKQALSLRTATVDRSSSPSTENVMSIKQEMTMPKVSVILTSRNHEKFLDEAIQSTLSQTYRNFELIIMDDASTDDSWSIIKQYNDSRIRAFRNDVQRYGTYNVNKAISEIAKGDYIAIHHSDDVWALEKLEKQVDFLDQHPETGAVFSWSNIISDDGHLNNDVYIHKVFTQDNKTRHEWLRHFFLSGNALCHPSVLIRKQCYTDCGLYNLALWQLPDFDMWIRLCFKYEIHVLPEYLVNFRWKQDGNNTSAVNNQTVNRASFEYYTILNNYCRIESIEELLKIFPSSEKYCTHPEADIEFALAMTAVEHNSSTKHHLFGLQLLNKLITSPEKAEKIRSVHHFDYMDFANISKQIQIFAPRQPSPIPQTPKSLLEQGIHAFNTEDHETAVECLSTAMTQEPDNPLPCAYLAFICARQGLEVEACNFIAQSTRLAPERADLIAALGEVFLKNSNPSEAVKYLREAVHAQPDLFAAYPAFAQSLHLTGQSGEAVSLLQTTAALPSNSQAPIQSTLLQILAECGDLSGFTETTLRFSRGLPDELLAARCLARFDENGEKTIETLSRIQAQLEDVIHSSQDNAIVIQNESDLTRIAFMVGNFTSHLQLEQLYALLRYLPPERFFTLIISCYTYRPKDDMIQMCALLADTPLNILEDEDGEAVEKIRKLAPDILIDMQAHSPKERLEVFLAAEAPHKFLWGESPTPSIAPNVKTLAGAYLSVENTLPTVNLPDMGEVFDLPELPFTDDTARNMGKPPVLGCLVPAAGIGRNGWQLFAETLRQHPSATLVINLDELRQAAQTFISAQFSSAGVDPTRLSFINACTTEEYCLAWQSIDLGLLPPVNPGGLALPTCLWMGKPCLIPGSILPWSQRPAALLKALGKEEWIAIGTPHYSDLALQLAPSGQRVKPDPTLRERMKAQGLTDPKYFAQGFADAMTGLLRDKQPIPLAASNM